MFLQVEVYGEQHIAVTRANDVGLLRPSDLFSSGNHRFLHARRAKRTNDPMPVLSSTASAVHSGRDTEGPTSELPLRNVTGRCEVYVRLNAVPDALWLLRYNFRVIADGPPRTRYWTKHSCDANQAVYVPRLGWKRIRAVPKLLRGAHAPLRLNKGIPRLKPDGGLSHFALGHQSE